MIALIKKFFRRLKLEAELKKIQGEPCGQFRHDCKNHLAHMKYYDLKKELLELDL